MIGGVSFQPGSLDQKRQQMQASGQSSEGVQEAIKVLSLRLPKVVGAQAVAPSALLKSQGSGGSPHVNSIVESVMAKMFPGAGGMQPPAPMMPMGQGPQFSGNIQGGNQPQREQGLQPTQNPWTNAPRIVVGNPPPEAPLVGNTPRWPNQPGVDGGPAFQPGAFEMLPDLKKQLEWVPQPEPPAYEPPPLI